MSLSDGLAGYYRLASDANDSVGSNSGTPTDITFSQGSAHFNGSTSNISIPGMDANATVSLWFTLSDYTKNYIIGGTGSLDYVNALVSLGAGGKLRWYFTLTKFFDICDVDDLTIDEPYNFVLITGDSNARVYLNSVLEVTHSTTDTPYIENLGAGGSESSDYHNGLISQYRIYGDIKDQAFINDLYAEGFLILPPESSGTIEVTGTADITQFPKSTANIEVTGSAEVTPYVPESTGAVEVTASAEATLLTPLSTAGIEITASSEPYASAVNSELFTFVYSIQQSLPESIFKFVYSIEQPKSATIIRRVSA